MQVFERRFAAAIVCTPILTLGGLQLPQIDAAPSRRPPQQALHALRLDYSRLRRVQSGNDRFVTRAKIGGGRMRWLSI